MPTSRNIMPFTLLRTLLLIGLLSGLAAGCASSQAPLMVRYWTLEYPAPAFKDLRVLPVVIRLNRFSAAHGFNSRDMVYSPSPLERGAYPYHRWLAPPSDLAGDLLARDLRACGLFGGVLLSNEQGRARFRLEGGVMEFLELNRSAGWKARLAVHITLLDLEAGGSTERVVLQRDYLTEKPIKAKGASGLARAMSSAMSQASARIISDLHQAVLERVD